MSNFTETVLGEAVVSVPSGNSILISHSTFKASEFLSKMETQLNASKTAWFNDGASCEILAPNKSWKKGKIKVVLQFCPDEPEVSDNSLDGIRQAIDL